jgi:hypothetical protein
MEMSKECHFESSSVSLSVAGSIRLKSHGWRGLRSFGQPSFLRHPSQGDKGVSIEMAMWLTRVAEGFRRFFYLFLDISGILLGVFLVGSVGGL